MLRDHLVFINILLHYSRYNAVGLEDYIPWDVKNERYSRCEKYNVTAMSSMSGSYNVNNNRLPTSYIL